MQTRAFAAGNAAHRGECGVRMLGRDDREELPFVGDVQRIEAEQLARAADRIVHRERAPQRSRRRSRFPRTSSFSAVATPPRVGSRIQRSPGAHVVDQRFDERPDRTRVRDEIGLQIELAARQAES